MVDRERNHLLAVGRGLSDYQSFIAWFGGLRRWWRAPKFPVMMSSDERTAVETVIGHIAGPVCALEWGSGGSTIHFAALVPAGSSWLSIEHQAVWFENVSAALKRREHNMVQVQLVVPDLPFEEGVEDGGEQTFRSYVDYPTRTNMTFNFALIDGRARNACARVAWKMLSDDGVMVLHDAQRAQYAPARPSDAWLVRLRDPRRQELGRACELHIFVKTNPQSLLVSIQSHMAPDIEVSLKPPHKRA